MEVPEREHANSFMGEDVARLGSQIKDAASGLSDALPCRDVVLYLLGITMDFGAGRQAERWFLAV